MENWFSHIEKDQEFFFSCSPDVSCFNACCRDLNQALAPFDVLCLKDFLKIPSHEFLDTYTVESIGPGSGLPVVSLRFGDGKDRTCPFVTKAGCRVYPVRPASCRMYPLARGVTRNRSTGMLTEQFALIHESHCQGFSSRRSQTPVQWMADQQLTMHNQMNDKMLSLIAMKNRCHPHPLVPAESERVYRALYDLDRFRVDWIEGKVSLPFSKDSLADSDLLAAAMEWVKETIFSKT